METLVFTAQAHMCFTPLQSQRSASTHQALALLAVLHPGVPAAVGEQAVLVHALAAQTGVALGAAEQVGVGVVAVAHHPAAHHLAGLSSSEREGRP